MKKTSGIKKKMLIVMIPVILACNLITFIIINVATNSVIRDTAEDNMREVTDSMGYEVSAEVMRITGIIENVKTSIEKSCNSTEEIQRYLYGIADAYIDIIPTGIYCGLTNGTYIDKMWVPDDDWVLTERPWYKEGLSCDDVTLGEAYMDAQTDEYVVSVYTNIHDSMGNVIGVVSADVVLSSIDAILTDKTVYDNGYVYGVDTVSGMVFSNTRETEQNGELLEDLDDNISKEVKAIIENERYGELVVSDKTYIITGVVPGSNFVVVCVATESDVLSAVHAIRVPIIIAMILSCVLISVMMILILKHFLKPVKKIMTTMDSLGKMNLRTRVDVSSNDEFGIISRGINELADSLRGVVVNIEDAISRVDERADTNEEAASRLGLLANDNLEAIEELSITIEQMATAMDELANKAGELSSEVGTANNAATEIETQLKDTDEKLSVGKKRINDMTDTMNGISDISAELQRAVNNMQEGLDGIKNMVDEINAVAAQTNLLSLNASIEAARAGEAGKGFAVVADEIRALADQTAQSAVNIVSTTDELEQLIGNVTRAAAESIDKISEGSEMVHSTNDTFNDIRSSMQAMQDIIIKVLGMLSRISDISEGMTDKTTIESDRTKDILYDCNKMKEISKDFSGEGSEVHTSGKELKELSVKLEGTMEQFIV